MFSKNIAVLFLIFSYFLSQAQNAFTEQDRRILQELNVKMSGLEQRQTGFEQRLLELREDMNKRFEQVDKRFEQVENSTDRIYTFLTILSGLFVAFMGGMFWFLYSERKNQVRSIELIQEKINLLEASNLLVMKVLSALKELANKDNNVKEALLHHNLI
ncbi:MAG: hypothetical protein ACKVOU_11205 [Cytophagales bacterium]